MFPEEPLKEDTKWQCEVCGSQIMGRQASIAQATLGRLLSMVDNRNIPQMERFLSQHHQVMPSSNQIVIELKCNLIRSYGHVKGYSWAGECKVELNLCTTGFVWYLVSYLFICSIYKTASVV
jgi:hypothetical protein